MTLPNVEAIARHALSVLVKEGFEVRVVNEPRGLTGIIFIRAELRVEFWYEPCGPPWCDVVRAGPLTGLRAEGAWARIAIGDVSMAAARMASGVRTPKVLRQHEQELRSWCSQVLRELKRSGPL